MCNVTSYFGCKWYVCILFSCTICFFQCESTFCLLCKFNTYNDQNDYRARLGSSYAYNILSKLVTIRILLVSIYSTFLIWTEIPRC